MARRSADPGGDGQATLTRRRSDRFLAGLADASRVTFVSHVHLDPDSLDRGVRRTAGRRVQIHREKFLAGLERRAR